MNFMRTITATQNSLARLGRTRLQNGSVSKVNMAPVSTQSSFRPKFESFSKPSHAKKTGITRAVGGFLACGGATFLHKAYTNEKFSFGPMYSWIVPQANCADEPDIWNWEKCEETSCFHNLDPEDECTIKANLDFKMALNDVKPKVTNATEEAVKAYSEATDTIKLYIDKAYAAIEQDDLESPRFEEVWSEVYELAVRRCEKVYYALAKGNCAWELYCRYREIVENGKMCKYTTCNPMLVDAQESLLIIERELVIGRNQMKSVQSESSLVERYKAVVEKFREELKVTEMSEQSVQSEPKCGGGIIMEDGAMRAMIINAANKKVIQVQKDFARTQVCSGCVPSKYQETMC